MCVKTELTYFLPVTRVCLRATMTRFVDVLEPEKNTTQASGWSAELVTVADPTEPRSLVVESGLLRDYGLKLALTEDGRLTSAGVELTGQVGTLLASAAGLATSIAAAMVFRFPALVPTTPPVVTKGGSGRPAGIDDTTRELSAVEERYLAERRGEAEHLSAAQLEHREALTALGEARRRYLEVGEVGRTDAWDHYRRTVRLLADVSEELARAKLLFDAWRHSHQLSSEYLETVTVPVAALPLVARSSAGQLELSWGAGDQAEEVRGFFEHTGYVLARTTLQEWLALSATTGPAGGNASLWVRRPRPVGLASLHRDGDQVLWLTGERRELIMDAGCAEVQVPLRKSWLARRKTVVELSPLGALTGVELGGEAAGVAVAAGVSGMGTGAVAALESAEKTRTMLAGLAAAGEEDELARLKRETALTEQRLLAAGRAATAADFVRLEWLRQQVAIAEAEAKLGAIR